MIYEADLQHVETLCEELHLASNSTGLTDSCVREVVDDRLDEETEGLAATCFRALAARANNLAQNSRYAIRG